MVEAFHAIKDWYLAYYADGFYLLFALFSYLYLFVHCPELRKKFLIPMAVIMFCALNPILYRYIYSEIVYWRLFWMFPTGILIALAAVKLVRGSQGKLVKGFVLAALCGLIVIKGTNIFQHGDFSKIQNPEKVPKAVQEVCDAILELDEHPRCIMPQPLLADVRQYRGEIEMLYGRDVMGYIIPDWGEDRNIFWQIASPSPDYAKVLQYAEKKDCRFVVTYAEHPIGQELLEAYGYTDIGYRGDYRIYCRMKNM